MMDQDMQEGRQIKKRKMMRKMKERN